MKIKDNSEYHLLIIWQNARYKQSEILKEINNSLSIIQVYEVEWSEDKFSENMTRFYGEKLPSQSHKEKHCGRGPFLLVILRDDNPVYLERDTISRSVELVNTNMFDLKTRLRKMTGGGHRIHATNDPIETAHDLILLLGISLENYQKDAPSTWNGNIEYLNNDLVGAYGWNSAEKMFEVLNNTVNYTVLRNFQGFPNELTVSGHEDVDFITDNYDNFIYIINATKNVPESYRVQHKIYINNNPTFIDVRSTTDGYYDPEWSTKLIKGRKFFNGFFVPSGDIYIYSLVYHALIHKWKTSPDYIDFIENNLGTRDLEEAKTMLDEFMDFNNFKYIEPKDLSVGFYYNSWSIKRIIYQLFLKIDRFKMRFNSL